MAPQKDSLAPKAGVAMPRPAAPPPAEPPVGARSLAPKKGVAFSRPVGRPKGEPREKTIVSD